MKLHIFNEHTILTHQFQIKTRQITHALFIDNQEMLALGGINGVSIYQLDYCCHYEPHVA